MNYYALRLHPGQDLKRELQQFIVLRGMKAGCIVSCVGSLQRAVLRFADRDQASVIEHKLEVLSLSGTLSVEGLHLHITLADSEGHTTGGHLMEGCLVYTTVEVVIGEIPDVLFGREEDPATGFKELVIRSL